MYWIALELFPPWPIPSRTNWCMILSQLDASQINIGFKCSSGYRNDRIVSNGLTSRPIMIFQLLRERFLFLIYSDVNVF